ncbi:MAG: DUF6789 family protein [Bacteroidota bacterium]
MNSSIQKSLIAGVVATAIMSLVMYLAPFMGLPEMNAAEMLSGMTGLPIVFGWAMHFMIGIIFTLGYTFFFLPNIRIHNLAASGALFGFAAFIVAQIAMLMMSIVIKPIPALESGMVPMMIGSIIGHIMFGIPVAFIVKRQQ